MLDEYPAPAPMEPPYASLADFATRHGIHPWQTRIAVNAGWLDLARGRMQDGQAVRTIGLWGQAQFFWIYRTHPTFRRCPDCPHGVQEPETIRQPDLFGEESHV